MITTASRPVSPRFLSEAERVLIADLRRAGATMRTIAIELRRAPSTIARELARNRDGVGRHRLLKDPELAGFVQDLLGKRWSPELNRSARRCRGGFPTVACQRDGTAVLPRAWDTWKCQ